MNTTNGTTCNGGGWYTPYCEFHAKDVYKMSILVLSSIMIAVTVALLYLVIWFEKYGADNKRILTNKIVSAICWNAIIGGLIAFFSDTIVYLFAPLPKSTCLLFGYLRMLTASNIMMFLNVIVISKYIFIFWLKNPGAVQDDFWMVFVCLWTFGLNLTVNFVRIFIPRKEMIYFYICMDQDPSIDQHLEQRKDEGVELVICILIHLAVSIRVKLFQKAATQPTEQGKIWTMTFNSNRSEKISLADFVTNFVLVCWVIILTLMLTNVSAMTVDDIGNSENSFYLFCFLYYANSVSGLVISGEQVINNV